MPRKVERPKSLGPVPKGTRLEHEPFEIEVKKAVYSSLGLTVGINEIGMVFVKQLTQRSPITKDGNIRYCMHFFEYNINLNVILFAEWEINFSQSMTHH